ncbi:unnamed protein product, partial [Ilex paraguariensis]
KKESELAYAVKATTNATIKDFKDSLDFKNENHEYYESGFKDFKAQVARAFLELDFSKIRSEDNPSSPTEKEGEKKEEVGNEVTRAVRVDLRDQAKF